MRLPSRIKTFVIALLFGVLILGLPKQVLADFYIEQTASQQQSIQVQTLTIEIMNAFICQLVGINPINPQLGCVTLNPQGSGLTTTTSISPSGQPQIGGLLGLGTTMIGGMYNMPVHADHYTRHLAGNFGITKQAQAQEEGKGFETLNPLLDLWQQIRNLAYLLFVGVFILIGLGIMLRVKIDPRTVMTLQNQIPKVIIGIILITFSYAIAGAVVDGMWVVTYAGTNVLTEKPLCGSDAPGDFTRAATNNLNNPIAYVTDLLGDETSCFGKWANGISGLSADLGLTVGDILSRTLLEVMGFNSDDITSKDCIDTSGKFLWVVPKPDINPGGCIEYAIFSVFKYFIGVAAILVIALATIVALFRVWISLIKSYVRVLLYVLFAPLWIMAGLLPNNTLGFSAWIRTLIANLAVFPATAFIFILASRFAANDRFNNPDQVSGTFIPPLVGNANIADNMGVIVAFGLILIAPELINTLRDALKTPASKYGPAVQRGITTGTAATGALASPILGKLWQKAPGKKLGYARDLFERKTAGISQKVMSSGVGRKFGLQDRADKRLVADFHGNIDWENPINKAVREGRTPTEDELRDGRKSR